MKWPNKKPFLQKSLLFSDIEHGASGVSQSSVDAKEEVPAKQRKTEVTAKESIAEILEMRRCEHELRMKYIEEEHQMKVKEHLLKMEILNWKKGDWLIILDCIRALCLYCDLWWIQIQIQTWLFFSCELTHRINRWRVVSNSFCILFQQHIYFNKVEIFLTFKNSLRWSSCGMRCLLVGRAFPVDLASLQQAILPRSLVLDAVLQCCEEHTQQW